jgi:hypothetical protein
LLIAHVLEDGPPEQGAPRRIIGSHLIPNPHVHSTLLALSHHGPAKGRLGIETPTESLVLLGRGILALGLELP